MTLFQGVNQFIPNLINNEWVKRFKTLLPQKQLNDNSVAKYLSILITLKSFLLTIGIKLFAEFEKMKVVERAQIENIDINN